MADESALKKESISESADLNSGAQVSAPEPTLKSGGSAPTGATPQTGRRRLGSLVAIGIFLLFAAFVLSSVKFVVVDGASMLPTLKNGQKLTMSSAYWLVGPIKDNDIVVLKDTGKTGYIIKRVYKMGGETVDYLNTPRGWSLSKGKYVVPPDHLFVLGDNYLHSEDSRYFGARPLSDVIGKIVRKP
jgi:signal peptidase I